MNLKDMLGQFAGNLPGRALQISWLKIDANVVTDDKSVIDFPYGQRSFRGLTISGLAVP
jgi:hypothetical protein